MGFPIDKISHLTHWWGLFQQKKKRFNIFWTKCPRELYGISIATYPKVEHGFKFHSQLPNYGDLLNIDEIYAIRRISEDYPM